MSMPNKTMLLALSVAAGLMAGSCKQGVECGTGTIEKDGVCTAEGAILPGGHCGSGTVYDPANDICVPGAFVNGACDGGLCGVCGANTVVEYDDAGVPNCIGTGGGGSCDTLPNCPNPAAGKFQVCGKIYNIADSQPIAEADTADIEVRIYDALGFANSTPSTRPAPLTVLSIEQGGLDNCGRYTTKDENGIVPPFTGFIAAAVEDLGATPGSDPGLYTLTGVALPAAGGGKAPNVNTFYTKTDTDMLWATGAGTGDAQLSTDGVYVPIFIHDGVPDLEKIEPYGGALIPGVKITENGAPDADKDFYFSDTIATNHLMVGDMDATEATGTGLYINGSLTMYSGVGAEPTGCTWPSTLAATVQGVVFVQERFAVCP
jgi:hypothetical protein